MEKAEERKSGTEGESETPALLLHQAVNTLQSQDCKTGLCCGQQ